MQIIIKNKSSWLTTNKTSLSSLKTPIRIKNRMLTKSQTKLSSLQTTWWTALTKTRKTLRRPLTKRTARLAQTKMTIKMPQETIRCLAPIQESTVKTNRWRALESTLSLARMSLSVAVRRNRRLETLMQLVRMGQSERRRRNE